MPPERKPKVPRRSPGLVIQPPPPRPPEDNASLNIFREAKAQLEPPATHQPPTDQPPPTTQPVAPERDFVRVPNSVVRDALPAGLFRGESKKTYDALYQRTRGAVVARRRVRATLADVMAWAGVSHNTLKAHLKHLQRVGLLHVHYTRGDNTGAEYEVFTPEEAPPTTHQPPTTRQPATGQILAPPTSQNQVLGGGGQSVDFQRTSGEDQTSFKTVEKNPDDDEAAPQASTPSTSEFAVFAELLEHLFKVSTEITGKSPPVVDKGKWGELGEVLSTELRIAAGRTTVSSVPAFLAEHLRRRLWKKDKKQLEAEGVAPGAKNSPSGPPTPGIGPSEVCPDCSNTGMWYPEGYEKGVARCLHPKLQEGN